MMKRRKFVRSIGALSALPILTGLYSWQVEPFWLEFVEVPLYLEDLPSSLEGRTLMQISDMHVGNRFPRKYLTKALDNAALFHPDIVVYTGDYVSYESDEQLLQLKEVMNSAVLGTMASYAILGNHDYGKAWSESAVADDISQILTNCEIKVLRNEVANVEGLDFVGLDDFWGLNFDPLSSLQEVSAKPSSVILCHNPDVADEPLWNEVAGIILSGHTHGGQVKPPFLDPPMLPVKNKQYSAGFFDLSEGLQMYINRALGHLWQVRLNVRPEITIFTLKRKLPS